MMDVFKSDIVFIVVKFVIVHVQGPEYALKYRDAVTAQMVKNFDRNFVRKQLRCSNGSSLIMHTPRERNRSSGRKALAIA